MKTVYSIAVLSFLTAMSAIQGADNMKAFAPAEAGMVRHVLQLPKQEDEAAFKVELIAGKTVQVDEGNRYFFGGKIEAENIKGWGFTRYMVSKLGPASVSRNLASRNFRSMRIHWKITRLDEGDEQDPRFAECLLEIEGWIECDGKPAGLVDAHYLFAEDPASDTAFMELWDLDATSCDVFEEIIDHDRRKFREPIPRFLDPASGFLCVNFIALHPPFRRMGLGREVMRELVRAMADPRIGVVLLDAQPLQHPHRDITLGMSPADDPPEPTG